MPDVKYTPLPQIQFDYGGAATDMNMLHFTLSDSAGEARIFFSNVEERPDCKYTYGAVDVYYGIYKCREFSLEEGIFVQQGLESGILRMNGSQSDFGNPSQRWSIITEDYRIVDLERGPIIKIEERPQPFVVEAVLGRKEGHHPLCDMNNPMQPDRCNCQPLLKYEEKYRKKIRKHP